MMIGNVEKVGGVYVDEGVDGAENKKEILRLISILRMRISLLKKKKICMRYPFLDYESGYQF